MQLADLNLKPHGGKRLRDLIDLTIGEQFYPPLGSEHYKIFCLDRFYGSTHINDNHRKNDKKKVM